jgi:hypothetical protein
MYEVKQVPVLIDYLKVNKKKPYIGFDIQLPTNYAHVYYLENGEVVLVPATYKPEQYGLLLQSKIVLDEMIHKDSFPIENSDKQILEYAPNALLKLPDIAFFKNYLDKKLALNDILDKTSIQKYYAGVLKLKKRNIILPLDYIALGILFESLIKQDMNGEWILLKKYGTFNPYFEPAILSPDKKIISSFGMVMGLLDNNVKDCKVFFLRTPIGIDIQIYMQLGQQIMYLK